MRLLARVGLQPLWLFLYRVSLAGMGYMNADPRSNGENRFLDRWAASIRGRGGRRPMVFDVGANEGDFSAAVAERMNDFTVHAFEPHPKTFARLKTRFANDGRFVLNNAAVAAASAASVTLYDYAAQEGSDKASLFGETFESVYPGHAHGIAIPAVTVDDYAERNGIEWIDLIKLDIEGGEGAALQGARRLFARGAIEAVQFEFNAHALLAGFSLLSLSKIMADFDIYRIVANGLVPVLTKHVLYNSRIEIFKYSNFVALHRSSPLASTLRA